MSSQTRAVLTILPCECECGNKWTEQEIIRRVDTGYSYDLDYDTYEAIFHRRILIEGTRVHSTRKVPVCYKCVDAPRSEFGWVDHPPGVNYYDFQTPEMKAAWANTPRRATRNNRMSEGEREDVAKKKIDEALDL